MNNRTYSVSKQSITDITPALCAYLAESNVENGVVFLEAGSATACLFHLENGVCPERFAQDLFRESANVIPSRITFASIESPATTAGFLKGAFFGQTMSVLVEGGKPVFDRKIYLADFCAPKDVTVAFCAMAENGGEKHADK